MMPRKVKDMWQTHVYLPTRDYKLLKLMAERESRSITKQIQHLVRVALENERIAPQNEAEP
jgi:hypothetical protein